MFRPRLATLGAALFSLLLVSATASGEPPYFVDESKLPFPALPDATALWGVHTGAGYRIEVPNNWNGKLVVWAHGFRGTGLELTVDNHPLRAVLIPLGYAWAASSYSRNDYDVTTGVQDTHSLLKRFNGLVGKPSQVLLTGASMGGHITVVSIEQYGKAYDGALAVCGALGDYELFDFFLDFNLAAQQLGTGSSTFPVDPTNYAGLTVPSIKANLEAAPGAWPLFLNADGTDFKNLVELRSGGDRPNFDEAWLFWNSIPSTSGLGNFLFDLGLGEGMIARTPGVAVDNEQTVYQFDGDSALSAAETQLNEDIFRVAHDPQGRRRNGLAQLPSASGDIQVPVMTLHNLGDLFVPVHNEVVYAERVAAMGKSSLLTQRAIRGVNHCGFTVEEFATAFLDLAAWVETGVKPAGDDFLDADEVASPDFGCQFTDLATPGGHILATPCP